MNGGVRGHETLACGTPLRHSVAGPGNRRVGHERWMAVSGRGKSVSKGPMI
jgi:hypothetical protein